MRGDEAVLLRSINGVDDLGATKIAKQDFAGAILDHRKPLELASGQQTLQRSETHAGGWERCHLFRHYL